MSEQPPSTPFGLEPNVAAGLAYLFGLIGGIVIFAGGGTNKFVKWAAAQSIVLCAAFIIVRIVARFLWIPLLQSGLASLYVLLLAVINVAWLAAWLWTFITGFQGKEVRVPVIANLTESLFKTSPG